MCEVWCHGSIIESRLLSDTAEALRLLSVTQPSGAIGGGETGKWAFQIAKDHNVAVPVLAAALAQREHSYKNPTFSSKIIAAVRYVFGGHELN